MEPSLYSTLNGRDKVELNCIALYNSPQYIIHTLDEVSIQSSSRACTLSTPLVVALCSVRLSTKYSVPGKAVPRVSPSNLFIVPLCIHSRAIKTALCLQMKVRWSEQFPPRSSRETVKLVSTVKCKCVEVYVCTVEPQKYDHHRGHKLIKWYYFLGGLSSENHN